MDIPLLADDIPYLSTEQMVEVDRAMIEDYQIELIQMMENAGHNLAHLARLRFLDGDPGTRKIVVLAGTGGNGGGGLVCARRLHNWGAQVQVFITKPGGEFAQVPRHQLDILSRMGVPVGLGDRIGSVNQPDLIIDGVIGYSLKGAPRGSAGNMIRWANGSGAPILALDAPSGVDTTSGRVFNPAIRAAATMTLALPKAGLQAEGVEEQVGELFLADISVPPALYSSPPLNLEVPNLFAKSEIIRIR